MTSTPASIPTATTMTVARTASAASERATRARPRNSDGSSSPAATTMMTPARADLGRGANSHVRNSSVTTTSAAATMPASCDLAPMSAAVKLRDWLPFTGKPPVSDAPMLAAPRPRNSPSPSTR